MVRHNGFNSDKWMLAWMNANKSFRPLPSSGNAYRYHLSGKAWRSQKDM
jgi:hypothetical protein